MGNTTLEKLAFARLGRIDPAPYDVRTGKEYEIVRVLIDSTTINQAIPNGNLVCNEQKPDETGKVADGTPYTEPRAYEIYENQLGDVMALVETATPEQLRSVEADLEHHTAECEGRLGDEAKNSRHYFPSFAASFAHIMHRDMLPFRSVKVLPQPKAKRAANG